MSEGGCRADRPDLADITSGGMVLYSMGAWYPDPFDDLPDERSDPVSVSKAIHSQCELVWGAMVQEGVEGELVNPVHTSPVNSFIGSGKQTLKSLTFNSTLWL
jgi:hypothetical protein